MKALYRAISAFEDEGINEYAVHFYDGKAEAFTGDDSDIILETDEAVFASVIMGALSARNACTMGLVRIHPGKRTPRFRIPF